MAKNKVQVILQYRDKNGKIKTKRKKCADKAELALFINPYVRDGSFVGYTQKGL
jgi:hypothetical protein